ncbi:hypothetical protein ACWX0K_23440 [Nitrobacteraceae bacterium UC4446_H13]
MNDVSIAAEKRFPDTVPKSDAGRTRIKLFQRWLHMASDAKSKVGEAAFGDEQGIQLHGGMGTSDEPDVRPLFQVDHRHQHLIQRTNISRAALCL